MAENKCITALPLISKGTQSKGIIPEGLLRVCLPFATLTPEQKYKVMLYLREGIKRNEVVETIHNIKERVPDAEKVVIEALQTKFFEDGRNLLMHAAAYGSKRAFIALARAILERVSTPCR